MLWRSHDSRPPSVGLCQGVLFACASSKKLENQRSCFQLDWVHFVGCWLNENQARKKCSKVAGLSRIWALVLPEGLVTQRLRGNGRDLGDGR
jgi:hypothetical protein